MVLITTWFACVEYAYLFHLDPPICSGYKVQFHLVDGSPSYIDGLPRISPEFLKPFGPLVPLEKAQKTPQPISFCVSYDTLPENITVGDDLLGGALKSGAVYSVVTVAYTKMVIVIIILLYINTSSTEVSIFLCILCREKILRKLSFLQAHHHNPLQPVSHHII